MAKQTFTTGQVLTAAQMTSLQQTAMLGGSASAKTASYTLVAADAGTAISMSNASATTITVNTALFAAGDTVNITNLGAGVCTITAGTATVNTSASLALAQYESGTLDFTSTSAAIFIKGAGAAVGGGLTLAQIATGSLTSGTSLSLTSLTSYDTLVLQISGFQWATADEIVRLRINSSTSASYNFLAYGIDPAASSYTSSTGATSFAVTQSAAVKDNPSGVNTFITLTNCKKVGFTNLNWLTAYERASNERFTSAQGMFKEAAAVSSIQFFTTSSYTFSAGTYILWGG